MLEARADPVTGPSYLPALPPLDTTGGLPGIGGRFLTAALASIGGSLAQASNLSPKADNSAIKSCSSSANF